jgi:hypothetical protein
VIEPEVHELLISEHEMLERDYDRLKLAKHRESRRLREEIRDMRLQLRLAVMEIEELQGLLAHAWVKT